MGFMGSKLWLVRQMQEMSAQSEIGHLFDVYHPFTTNGSGRWEILAMAILKKIITKEVAI